MKEMQTVAVFCVLQEIRLCFLFGIGVSPGATAMKDASNKSPSEEQSPPAAPSVIRDERRWERREQKNGEGGEAAEGRGAQQFASELHKRRGKFASL